MKLIKHQLHHSYRLFDKNKGMQNNSTHERKAGMKCNANLPN